VAGCSREVACAKGQKMPIIITKEEEQNEEEVSNENRNKK
jgi:hypothetical protein